MSNGSRSKIIRFVCCLLMVVAETCFLLVDISCAETKISKVKSPPATQCYAEYFKDYEKLAKQEVTAYRVGESNRADLVEFVFLVNSYKRDAKVFCSYSSSDYLALLWLATLMLKTDRDAHGPFQPDTFVSRAERRLDYLWNDGFRFGWNGFPKNPKQSSCLLTGVLQNLDKCKKLNPVFFAKIRAMSIPAGWELPE